MNCNGNCSGCPFGAAERAAVDEVLTVAVTGAAPRPSRTIVYKGHCVRFHYMDEISSVLDLRPDMVLHVADSMDLDNTLYPVTKVIDMDLRSVVALTRYGDLLSTGHSIDCETLGALLGSPVVPFEFDDEDSLRRILEAITTTHDSSEERLKAVQVPYGRDIEKAAALISSRIAESHSDESECFTDRYMALRLLENQDYIMPYVERLEGSGEIVGLASQMRSSLEKNYGEKPEALITKARRGFINGALQETLRHSRDNSDHTFAQKVDSVLTNRWLGLPILLAVLFLVFAATFALGAYPQAWIEKGVSELCGLLGPMLGTGWFSSLVVDGVVRGVGAVLAFVPNIMILFFFLSILEDSGYMARAAFLMDKLMHRVGLHGRSFIPMLIGFGCNVPAIMAARSIDDRKDRTLTMLMIPFMSCSARLPVYMLFVGAFFVRYKALVMCSIYLCGILLSILFAFVMKRTKYFRKEADDYVSELPAFRRPTWRSTGLHIWERVSDYLQKISTVILAASVIIWALEYFPADRTQGGELKEESCLAMIGRGISPVMEPLGFDWKMNVCLLTGLPAKEAIVSTMGILYRSEDDGESLAAAMRESGDFTTANALSFMVFVLLYFPCIATIATLRREIGRKWAAFTVVHSLLLAWLAAFLVFHLF
ncbi:MAG: ferrous iron transport protein B [Bacteroidales bacterium]|nr:ferrous iron transport protein B [Bacteroidales bacterium]